MPWAEIAVDRGQAVEQPSFSSLAVSGEKSGREADLFELPRDIRFNAG